MLTRLTISDIVLIEKLDIEFGSGLTVLTGETGAGKSILLDALSLALGARGDGALVREGSEQGVVTAVFDMAADHAANTLLADNAIPAEDSLILRRLQNRDGRSRAFINDQPVSVSLLRDIGASLVEIHGQHDDRALIDPATHRRLLDSFGGLEALAAEMASAWAQLQQARNELAEHRARVDSTAREADYLRASVDELALLAPEEGEEAALAEARSAMMQAEKLATDLHEAREQIAGSASPIPALSSLLRRLERKAGAEREFLQPAIASLDAAVEQLQVAAEEVEALVQASRFDPQELERSEERLFALRAAARKYGVPADNLADHARMLAQQLAELDAGEERLAELKARIAPLEEKYDSLAGRLSLARREAGQRMSRLVEEELPTLKLEQARFIVSFDEVAAGPSGVDRVEFQVQTNPGSRAGPMAKIASGGELSRFLLALKVVLAEKGSAPTLIFDEIDSGVGGAVADAIGRRLAQLAQKVQVISVTHAPQVAARADAHLLISKGMASGVRAATNVAAIGSKDRREEIARMLAGATITDEARAAADRLIGRN